VKEPRRGVLPTRRVAIVCMSVVVVALLLAASAVPVLAATNTTSDKNGGDKLTNKVQSATALDDVVVTLTEDSRKITSGKLWVE
jgi:cytochrome c oxidase assembly protein Cox11